MKLLYITNARIPTEKAHGVQIIKMCEAFQSQGVLVELLVPFRMQTPSMKQCANIWDLYDVQTIFPIRHLFTPDFVRLENVLPSGAMTGLYYLQCAIFSVLAFLLTCLRSNSCYYSRDLQTIFLLCLTKPIHRKRVYFEAHELHGASQTSGWRGRLMRWMLQRLDGIVVITRRLQTLYAGMGIAEDHILMAPDGVDTKRLSFSLDKFEAREKLEIPLGKKIIAYTGHLFPWKGVYTLAECGRFLPDEYLIYIVGGTVADFETLQGFVRQKQLKNVLLTGYIPYAGVPKYLRAADVLVLPNSSKERISQEYTSPLKLFEYMGAQRPIVASDLPSLREVLCHKKNAYLVESDNPKALAEAIVALDREQGLSEKIVKTAFNDVQGYTWTNRAKTILQFIR